MKVRTMKNRNFSIDRAPRQEGISLIIVLIMMVIIGITAASAMRNATSSERATNNQRLDNVAQQYAEVALRYCEGQLRLPDAQRVATLQNAVIPTIVLGGTATTGWETVSSWTGVPGGIPGDASATRTPVPTAYLSAGNASWIPAPGSILVPQCITEIQQMAASSTATYMVVTARGFSPDYARDANGQTTSGAVVWLQSILNL